MLTATRWMGILLLWSSALPGAVEPSSIPRSPTKRFRTEGLFQGGGDARANLEALRVAEHGKLGFERWVIDFSDDRLREIGRVAPRFQLEYQKADKWTRDDGTDVVRRPARFVFRFRNIAKNRLTRAELTRLQRRSRYVKEILLYPPIEQGDLAMELILASDVAFEPHQPIEREGRLVLDLRRR